MKKNTSRVRSNGAIKAPSPQVQTDSRKTLSVVIFGPQVEFEADEGTPVEARFELPETLFRQFQADAAATGIAAPEFIQDSMREKLGIFDPEKSKQALRALIKLETAIQQSHAFEMLLLETVNRSSADEYCGDIQMGFVYLLASVQEQLKSAAEAVGLLIPAANARETAAPAN